MGAVLVILAPEQSCAFVEPGAVQRGQVFRQTVYLLIDVRLHQVEHAADLELMLLAPAPHEPIGVQVDATAGIFRQRWFQRHLPYLLYPKFGAAD